MNTDNFQNNSAALKNLIDIASAKIAFNSITPMIFDGAIAGSEFLTYDAKKIYIGLHVIFSNAYGSATINRITIYNEANAVMNLFSNSMPYQHTDNTLRYSGIDINLYDIWFSRIVADIYQNIHFNGYKLVAP